MCRISGDLLNHEPGDDKSDGVVLVCRTGFVEGALFDRPINDFFWFKRSVESSAGEHIETEVERKLGKAIGVIENLSDGDGVAVINPIEYVARSPTVPQVGRDRCIEVDEAFLNEL